MTSAAVGGRPVEVEFIGGPACGATHQVHTDHTGEIPAFPMFRVPLDVKFKPILLKAGEAMPSSHAGTAAMYTLGLPRHGRWLYRFVGMEPFS